MIIECIIADVLFACTKEVSRRLPAPLLSQQAIEECTHMTYQMERSVLFATE